MEVVHYISKTDEDRIREILKAYPGGTAITLGKFDGIHQGHEILVNNIVTYKESFNKSHSKNQQMAAVVVAFGKAIYTVVKGDIQPVLTSAKEKEYLLAQDQIDLLIEYPFTKEVMNMDAHTFLQDIIIDLLDCKHVVVGIDFCFGKGRMGDGAYLKRSGDKYGFTTCIVHKLQYECEDISSSRIMQEVRAGNMKAAQNMLGRAYFIMGNVVHGNHLGAGMGFATANIEPNDEKLLPPNGVYYTKTYDLTTDREYDSVTNIGYKPTVTNASKKTVETNLLHYEGDLYGHTLIVSLIHFSRPERKFCSKEDLIAQVLSDQDSAKIYYLSHRDLY